MDYSKVKYVKPSEGGLDITKDKVYEFSERGKYTGYVKDDSGFDIIIFVTECPHLDNSPWIPCTKDGTPL